ncbi:MAG: cupin domain-containing protein [Thermodesulfobacteriota bacterium]
MVLKANWTKLKRVQVRNGVTRRVFSGKNSMMVLNELMPGAKPALHRHPHEQLIYIIEGTCRLVIGNEVVDMAAGDLILVPPDMPHSLEVTSDKPVLNLDVFAPIREDYLAID